MTSLVSVLAQARNETLLNWYSEHQRELPWRLSNDPYRVLVSEVMLQQTQVERGIDRFERFISRWPTARDLAAATNDEVLSEWSGLGYNSRAIRLRDSARIIAETEWPDTVSDLMELPGVGPYTAAAVASIAFGEHVSAVDTNLKRVISRWRGDALNGPELDTAAREELGHPAGDWNQALMDLGSQLCTPRNPSCAQCPVSTWCTDPSIYQPPTPHPTFKGSNRQLRGALVKAHLNGENLQEAGRLLDRSQEDISAAIEDLSNEGLIAQDS
jgi:A/G-specific adenine glycosylase